jgi:hypothetical protein
MRYALIADIDANLPALQTVIDDILNCVAGNHDSTVATDYKHCGLPPTEAIT